jgi:serine/threonine protein kinase/tetratricopeptide (TPR) repeat protein
MTPERWRTVQEVFAAATERDPESMDAFLEEACGGDEALLHEVESLIHSLNRVSSGFLESPLAGALETFVEEKEPEACALSAGTRLGSYEILGPIGAGGMGEVYRARDLKLDRKVAVKVLPEEVAADPVARGRFEREAKLVAELSHPNILAIFDYGTHDGITYAVMELLEGETLRAMLEKGPLMPERASTYALQIARGLSAAHGKGIVHRDLKPENVFVTVDDHVKILDFGLSKHVEDGVAIENGLTAVPIGFELSEAGRVMGTVGYMSPEQASGLSVDARSDIFSFGTILYEMLCGRRAFRRDTPAETITAILEEEPLKASDSGHHIPAALDPVIRRCLEKDRDRRFSSARDLVRALSQASEPTPTSLAPSSATRRVRTLTAAALIGLLAAAGTLSFRHSRTSAGDVAGVRRVAVLPFENAGAPDDGYFAGGVSDAVRGKLASLPGLQVIAEGSSTLYKQTKKNSNQIARELGVTYLLTGTVHRQQSRPGVGTLEVRPELIEISDSGPPIVKWEQTFDAPLTAVFQVQSGIASRAADVLGVVLAAQDEKRLSERPTINLEAYDAFLRGEDNYYSRAGDDTAGLKRDLALYERAVALDPDFPEAWARIAMTSAQLYRNGVSAPDVRERAEHAASTAMRLDPNRPGVFLARSLNEGLLRHDLQRALEISEEGRRLWPTDAMLINNTASIEFSLGHLEAAVGYYRQGRTLDPRLDWGLGEALTFLRRYPEALPVIEHAMAVSPQNLQLIQDKAYILLAQGDLAGTRAALNGAPAGIDPLTLVVFMATDPFDWDMSWALDAEQRELLFRATPGDFGDDPGQWNLALAVASSLKGDVAATRSYAEQARRSFDEQLGKQEFGRDNHRIHMALGLALAYLGRKDEAVREGERVAADMPVTRDFAEGMNALSNLVRIYVLVGEPEKALDNLEKVLKLPAPWAPGWLRIDPNFDPLRSNPRFQKLAGSRS